MGGPSGIGGPNINNIQGPDSFKGPEVGKTAAAEKLPTTQEVKNDLESKPTEDVKESVGEAIEDLREAMFSGKILSTGAANTVKLAPLSEDIRPAAKTVAENIKKDNTLANTAATVLKLTISQKKNKTEE